MGARCGKIHIFGSLQAEHSDHRPVHTFLLYRQYQGSSIPNPRQSFCCTRNKLLPSAHTCLSIPCHIESLSGVESRSLSPTIVPGCYSPYGTRNRDSLASHKCQCTAPRGMLGFL